MSGAKSIAYVAKADGSYRGITMGFDTSLKGQQEAVGGYIERVALPYEGKNRELDLWVNEEGKNMGLEQNFIFGRAGKNGSVEVLDIIVGDVVFLASTPDGETVGLDKEEISFIMKSFKEVKDKEGNTHLAFLVD